MSEGLVALKNILNNDKVFTMSSKEYSENVSIIEKELKDYQEINAKYKLAIEFINNIADEFGEHDLDELTDKIVNVKKALEIIKEKQVNIAALLELDSLQQYNDYCDMVGGCKKLIQEEYELLKEVLL